MMEPIGQRGVSGIEQEDVGDRGMQDELPEHLSSQCSPARYRLMPTSPSFLKSPSPTWNRMVRLGNGVPGCGPTVRYPLAALLSAKRHNSSAPFRRVSSLTV